MKTQKVQFKSSFGLMLYMWIRRLLYAVILAGAGSAALIAWITGSFQLLWSLVIVGLISVLQAYWIFRVRNTKIIIDSQDRTMEVWRGGKSHMWEIAEHIFEPNIATNSINYITVSHVRQIVIDGAYVETCHNMSSRSFDRLMALLQGLSVSESADTQNTSSSRNETIGTFMLHQDRLIPRLRWRLLALSGLFLVFLIAPFIFNIYISDEIGKSIVNAIAMMTATIVFIPVAVFSFLAFRYSKRVPRQMTVTTRMLIIDDMRMPFTEIVRIELPESGNGEPIFNLRSMNIDYNGRKFVYTTGFLDDDKQPEGKAVFSRYEEFVSVLGDACRNMPGKLVFKLKGK